MGRYTCTTCGVVLNSSTDAQGHRRRTHPDDQDLTDMGTEISDTWTMITACVLDRQWIWASLAIVNLQKQLTEWLKAIERNALR